MRVDLFRRLSLLKRFLVLDFGVFIVCAFVFYAIVIKNVLPNFQNAPEDRVYYGADDNPIDMVGNLSYIQTGMNGHWQLFVKYSSALPDQKSFLKFEYILLGHIAQYLSANPLVIFFISRTLISFIYLWVIYFLITKVFRNKFKRSVAIILVLFSTSIYNPEAVNWTVKGLLNDVSVFQRVTVAAHHYMLGGLAILLSMYFLARVIDRSSDAKAFIFAAFFGFISSQVYAPNSVIVLSCLPLLFIVKTIRTFSNKRIHISSSLIGILFAYAVIISLPIMYIPILRMTAWQGFSFASNLEGLNPYRVDFQNYIYVVGFVYLFCLIALFKIAYKGSTLLILLGAWVIMHPIGEFFIVQLIKINQIRYFLTPYFVVFGIVGTEGIFVLGNIFKKINKKLYGVVVISLVAVVLVPGYWSYQDSQLRLRTCFCSNGNIDYTFPKKSLMQAMFWLHTHTQEDDIVLTDTYTGNMIPGFAGNRVYVSWWYYLADTSDPLGLLTPLKDFFNNQMTETEERWFTEQYKISYVLYDDYARAMNEKGEDLKYFNLQEIIRFDSVILYKVIKR